MAGKRQRPLFVRFITKVQHPEDSECWIWTGAKNDSNRGIIHTHSHNRHSLVHRVSYELFVGPIPAGMTIDHVKARGCTSTLCVNPAHLEPVTLRENIRRHHAEKTHCPNGHEYTDDNVYLYKGGRNCRQCRRDRNIETVNRREMSQ